MQPIDFDFSDVALDFVRATRADTEWNVSNALSKARALWDTPAVLKPEEKAVIVGSLREMHVGNILRFIPGDTCIDCVDALRAILDFWEEPQAVRAVSKGRAFTEVHDLVRIFQNAAHSASLLDQISKSRAERQAHQNARKLAKILDVAEK